MESHPGLRRGTAELESTEAYELDGSGEWLCEKEHQSQPRLVPLMTGNEDGYQ
jgi:hypothetical protein